MTEILFEVIERWLMELLWEEEFEKEEEEFQKEWLEWLE